MNAIDSSIYKNFTDRARMAMGHAKKEALQAGQNIGAEHILLGVLAEGTGVGANFLRLNGLDLKLVLQELAKVGPAQSAKSGSKVELTASARNVIECAAAWATEMGHNFVGTEHLVLGLLEDQPGVVQQVFLNCGLKLDQLRRDMLDLLGVPRA